MLQQAAEKALKGFLLARGQPLRFTHDLELLLGDAVTFDPALAKYEQACEKVSLYYIQERYPGERRLMPSVAEFEAMGPQVEAMIADLRNAAGRGR